MTEQLAAMLIGAAWCVAVSYLALGNGQFGQRRVADCAFFAMLLFVAGAWTVAAFGEPVPTYPVQVRFSSTVLAESHIGTVQNGNDLPIVQPIDYLSGWCDGEACEHVGLVTGADPTREVTVTVAAMRDGVVRGSNAIVIPPQVPICVQMDLDDQPGVTATDVARVMRAVVEGECE